MLKWLKNIFHKFNKVKVQARFELGDGKFYEEDIDIDNFIKRTDELQKQLYPRKPLDQLKFIWCLVGNIIDEHYEGEEKEIRHGTKHFSPGTKVYCFPPLWGDGYENIKVIGRHRKSKRFICIIMPSRFITNWRLQQVYRPYILKAMHSQNGWMDTDEDKERILEMLKWLPGRTAKMDK